MSSVPPSYPSAHTSAYALARRRGWLWGALAALGLALLYGLTLSLANSIGYAVDTFLALWYWMAPLVVGFGAQAGLFAYSRSLARAGASPHASGVVASGGTGAVAMVACCAHHLVDVLPLVGLAGVALFLGNYQSLFLLGGLLSNAVGITYLLGEMSRHHLYPPEGRLLAPLLRFPLHRAVGYVAGVSAGVLALAIYWEVWG